MRHYGVRVTLLTIATVMFLLHSVPSADTGFLDRSITMGGETYRYMVYVPPEWRKAQSWPVMIYLHGNGGQGTDGARHTTEGGVPGLWAHIRNGRPRYPLIILFPQARPDMAWSTPRMQEMAMAELEATLVEFHGDQRRAYLAGFSMGARGVLRMAARWPGRFAALVAVSARSGPGSPSSPAWEAEDRAASPYLNEPDPHLAIARKIGNVPLWLLHGDADQAVPAQESRQLAAAFKQIGATQVRYTEYAGLGHVPSYEKAFSDPEVMTWLLANRLPGQ